MAIASRGVFSRRNVAAGLVALAIGLGSGVFHDAGRVAGQMPPPAPVPDVIVGPGSGAGPVRIYRATDGRVLASDVPFGAGFSGGVDVATGDVDGDGLGDIVTAMAAGGGRVRVFSGVDTRELLSGEPFGPEFTGGVSVAAGDIDGDGRAEVITGQRAAGGEVRIYDHATRLLIGETPFGASYTGGVRVAAGDVTGDGRADVIVSQAAGGLVRIFDGVGFSTIASGSPYGAAFAGGVHVAAGDTNGDGRDDVIVGPGAGAEPVRIFDLVTEEELARFVAYWPGHSGGVRVAAGDVDGDGRAEIITAPGSPGSPLIRVFDIATLTSQSSVVAYDSPAIRGAFVAVRVPRRLGFTSGGEATFRIGEAARFVITTTGASPLTTITLAGSLPAGLAFTDDGRGTAVLSGSPQAGTRGAYALTLTATTGVAPPVAQPFTLTILAALNTAPSFAAGADQTAAEDSGPQVVAGWASAMSPGGPRETGQAVSFVVTGSTNPSLFSAAPAVSAAGTLTYTAAENASGTAIVTLVLRDDGGTEDGGQDMSAPHQLTITVTPIEDLCSPGTYTGDGARLDGAAYAIKIPDAWNGTLVVYARHYTPARPLVADTFWTGLPESLGGSAHTRQQDFETPLLAAGYALAGSTLRDGGWMVEEGQEDLTRLATIFHTSHCVPTHTIVAGFDMGALIALKSLEADPPLFDGAVAACAPAAGMTRTVDRLLRQNLAIEATLAWPAAWGAPGDVRDGLTPADIQAVHYLTVDDLQQFPALFPALEFIRLTVRASSSFFYDPPSPSLRTLLTYSTRVMADVERRSGGPVARSQPSTISARDRERIDFLIEYLAGEPCHPDDAAVCPLPAGSTADRFLADMNALTVTPDPAARARLVATGDLTGRLNGPLITLHSTVDAPFPATGTSAYLADVAAQGREGRLLRAFTQSLPGHCEFLPGHLVGALAAMRSWLETGVRPAARDEAFFPTRAGFANGFNPGPWPF